MQKFLIGFVVAVVLAVGAWWFTTSRPPAAPEAPAAAPTPAAAEPAAPRNEEAVKALGEGLDLQLGREPEKALKKFDQALAKDSQLKGVRYQMAVAAYQAGDMAKARQSAQECITGGENVADAHILLGTMAARDGKHDDAAKEFAAAAAADPANAMA